MCAVFSTLQQDELVVMGIQAGQCLGQPHDVLPDSSPAVVDQACVNTNAHFRPYLLKRGDRVGCSSAGYKDSAVCPNNKPPIHLGMSRIGGATLTLWLRPIIPRLSVLVKHASIFVSFGCLGPLLPRELESPTFRNLTQAGNYVIVSCRQPCLPIGSSWCLLGCYWLLDF